MWVNSRCAIAAWLECFQEKPRTVSEWTGLPGEDSVKRFERSNGLDTALYKTIPFFFLTLFVQPHTQQAGIFREDDQKWRTFKFTLELLEPHWPDSEQRSDVIHGSDMDYLNHFKRRRVSLNIVLPIFHRTHFIVYLLWPVWKILERKKSSRFVSMKTVAMASLILWHC